MKQSGPKPPHPGDLIKTMRRLVAAGAVDLSIHVLDDRLEQRGFDISDVYKVLEQGDIDGAIVPGKNPGEWKCLVIGRVKWSPREIGVATIVIRAEKLFIKTVEWMDP